MCSSKAVWDKILKKMISPPTLELLFQFLPGENPLTGWGTHNKTWSVESPTNHLHWKSSSNPFFNLWPWSFTVLPSPPICTTHVITLDGKYPMDHCWAIRWLSLFQFCASASAISVFSTDRGKRQHQTWSCLTRHWTVDTRQVPALWCSIFREGV